MSRLRGSIPTELSEREREILNYMMNHGGSNQEIAAAMNISMKTVKNHMQRIFQKLGVDNRVAAVVEYMHQQYGSPNGTLQDISDEQLIGELKRRLRAA